MCIGAQRFDDVICSGQLLRKPYGFGAVAQYEKRAGCFLPAVQRININDQGNIAIFQKFFCPLFFVGKAAFDPASQCFFFKRIFQVI